MKIDTLDIKIFEILGRDGTQSYDDIAKQLDVSPSTIRRRIRKHKAEDRLRIIGCVDHFKIGYKIVAHMTFNVELKSIKSVVKTLSEQPEIKWLALTTGRFDIIASGLFKDNLQLNEFITERLPPIKGIKDVETYTCLEVIKGKYFSFGSS